ncbi:Protein kinase-like domain containing protein, partial [Naviculisporaceae sp. PSN 640]
MASSLEQPKILPELVRDSQLETRFDSKRLTIHTFHDTPTTKHEEVWKREKLIGRGAFGEVWREKCIKRQETGGPETRAVKILRFIPQVDIRLQVTDYSRELEALAKFSQRKFSRCFVKSYGWFHGRDILCVSLEYLPLGDLRGYLSAQGGRISQLEAQQIASQLLYGLKFMHEEGFTHRDLKPANVLIKDRPPSGSWWIVLSDFGLTKRVQTMMSGISGMLGTPGYMAPELYGYFSSELDGIDYSAADIWCVGEISFQMISGEPTFSFQATLFSYARGECEFPIHKLKDCSPDVDPRAVAFITALMIANPAHRPDAAAASAHPWIANHREQAYLAAHLPSTSVLN